MTDYVPLQIKYLEIANCLFRTTDLLYMFCPKDKLIVYCINICDFIEKGAGATHFMVYIVSVYNQSLDIKILLFI